MKWKCKQMCLKSTPPFHTSWNRSQQIMHSQLANAFWFVVVAAMWGATNPLLKKTSKGVEDVKKEGRINQFISELLYLVCNWKYLLSFLTNQMGSVVYYLTLSSADLTLAVPVTNSLTFIFTALSSFLLGERSIKLDTLIGMAFVVSGVVLCVLSKG